MPQPENRLRRVTAHVLVRNVPSRFLPGARVCFTDDPADAARAGLDLPPGTPLTACGTRTQVTTLSTDTGTVSMHVDRLFYSLSGRTPHPWEPVTAPEALQLLPLPRPEDLLTAEPPHPRPALRRFSCYGIATDPAGRVLLSKIAPGYPDAGTWHLPGGGTDHGESPQAALRRELVEETGQHAAVGELIAIRHYFRTGQIGPESPNTDICAVWVIFRARVARPSAPRVTEAAGSACAAAWFSPEELNGLHLSTVARTFLDDLTAT